MGRVNHDGLDEKDRAILNLARSTVTNQGSYGNTAICRQVGMSGQAVHQRIQRMQANGFWPFGEAKSSREPKRRPPLSPEQQSLALSVIPMARRLARLRSRGNPRIYDEVESYAMYLGTVAASKWDGSIPFQVYAFTFMKHSYGLVAVENLRWRRKIVGWHDNMRSVRNREIPPEIAMELAELERSESEGFTS